MDCTIFRSLIFDGIRERLGDDVAREVTQHLGACAACGQALVDARRVHGALLDRRSQPPSRRLLLDVRDQIYRALDDEDPGDLKQRDVWTTADLARYLRLSPRELEPYFDRIPGFELAGQRMFRRSAVEAWLARLEE